MSDKIFHVQGKQIHKKELTSVFADLFFFGVLWDKEGKSFVYNYIANRWEEFTDSCLEKYLISRRKILGINLRGGKEKQFIWCIRYLAKSMEVSEKWFKETGDCIAVDIDENAPEMEWEKV